MNEIATQAYPEREVTHVAPSQGDQPQNLMALISGAVMSGKVDTDTVKALLDVQERIERRQAEADFNSAFARMAVDMPRIKKTGAVEYKGALAFKFAKWEDIDGLLRKHMRDFGFSLSFGSQRVDAGLEVTAKLRHEGGHMETASMVLPADSSGGKNPLQGWGSSMQYGQRYTSKMVLNYVTEGEDDDGVRGGTVYITAEQAEALRTDFRNLSPAQDEPGFLRYMDVRDYEEIEAKDHAKARNAIETTRRALEKRSKAPANA